MDQVGNMVMADDGVLVQQGNTWIWRFHAYLTSLAHEPDGPIGTIDVDANTGAVLSDQHTIEEMYEAAMRINNVAGSRADRLAREVYREIKKARW